MSVPTDKLSSFDGLTFDRNFSRTNEKQPEFTPIRGVSKYEKMMQTVSNIIMRLQHISENSEKTKDVQAGIKSQNIQKRLLDVLPLLEDESFLDEMWNTLPERVQRRLGAKYDNNKADIQDELKSAFLCAYLKKDLRSTRDSDWLNWGLSTQGNTTSYKALQKTAKGEKIDSDLQECLRRRIRDPGTYWQPCKKEDRQQDLQNRTVTIYPKLVYGEQKWGHAGAQIMVEDQHGSKTYFRVEGFGEKKGGYWSGQDKEDQGFKFEMEMKGGTTIEFLPIKITPNQYKLLKLNLADCRSQRYSGLAYNCSHTARRALRFCGIDLESKVMPKKLAQNAIDYQLKDIEKRNVKIWEGLTNKEEPNQESIPTLFEPDKKEKPIQEEEKIILNGESDLEKPKERRPEEIPRDKDHQLDLEPESGKEEVNIETSTWRPWGELDETRRTELWGMDIGEMEQKEKVFSVVKERLTNEIKRIDLEIAELRIGLNQRKQTIIDVEAILQERKDSLELVLKKFSEHYRQSGEVKSAFKQAVNEVRKELGKDNWRVFYKDTIQTCLEGDIWRHLDQLYPKNNN